MTDKLIAEVVLRSLIADWREDAEEEASPRTRRLIRKCADGLEKAIKLTSPLRVLCDYDPRLEYRELSERTCEEDNDG